MTDNHVFLQQERADDGAISSPANLEKRDDGSDIEAAKGEAGISQDNLAFGSSNSFEDVKSEGVLSKARRVLVKHRTAVLHLVLGVVMTGWWIAGLILHRKDRGWLIPFLIWFFLSVRLITFHISTKFVTKPIVYLWKLVTRFTVDKIPEKWQLPLGAAATVALFLVVTLTGAETSDNTRIDRFISLLGLLVFIGIFWATSNNRKLIKWRVVVVGMLMQYLLALFVLRTKAGYDIFNYIAFLAESLLGSAAAGTQFLLSKSVFTLGYFLINVIPPIIFFIAFVQLLYYWGWLQWAIGKFATIFFYAMGVSGAEAVVAAASPFVGQGESAMLIKPFIPHLTDAELHQVMTSGFATIAGSVLAAYIRLGISPLALISSCVMSIPASLAISKLRWPETELPLTSGKVVVPADEDEKPANSLHAFAIGSWVGIKVGGMIVAVLLCILALLQLTDNLLSWWGSYLSIKDLTIELIIGYIFVPVAFLLGVDRNSDLIKVARLIGTKVVVNEFVAFANLSTLDEYKTLSPRSQLIATYAVCGFGNISSVGIQIGVLSQLAPGRSGRIAKVALSALISGVVSTLTSASIAGMLLTDQGMIAELLKHLQQ